MPPDTVHSLTDQPEISTTVERSQASFGGVVQDALVRILLTPAVERAGAERALLIALQGDGRQQFEADASNGDDAVRLRLPHASMAPAQLPGWVLDLLIRIHGIVPDDAWAPNQLSANGYIQQKQPRSILCLALGRQDKLIGLLYLENRWVPGAFSPPRVAVLKRLAQPAIPPDNKDCDSDLWAAGECILEYEREPRLTIETISGWNMSIGYGSPMDGSDMSAQSARRCAACRAHLSSLTR